MTMGRRAPLRRRLGILAAPLLAVGVFASHVQPAGAIPLFACPHFHAVWSYVPLQSFGVPMGIAVSSSACIAGTATSLATSGSGTVTQQQPGGLLTGTGSENHYDLTLSVGGTSVHTVFDAVMVPVAPPGQLNLSASLAYAQAGTVQFEGAGGGGVMVERCTFDSAANLITCTDDGSFVSE